MKNNIVVYEAIFSRKWGINILILLDESSEEKFNDIKKELGCTAKVLVIALTILMQHKLVAKTDKGYEITMRGKNILARLR